MNNLEVLIQLQHELCAMVDQYATKPETEKAVWVYRNLERDTAEQALVLGWAIDIIEMARK